jgi:hypothetical protein
VRPDEKLKIAARVEFAPTPIHEAVLERDEKPHIRPMPKKKEKK